MPVMQQHDNKTGRKNTQSKVKVVDTIMHGCQVKHLQNTEYHILRAIYVKPTH